MTSEQQAASAVELPIEEMAMLDFIRWDRYTSSTKKLSLFGWIPREDGRSDFVLLTVIPEGIGFTTSSAEYSEEISRRLNGGEPTGTHNDCLRVEAHPAAAELPNVVRLQPKESGAFDARRLTGPALKRMRQERGLKQIQVALGSGLSKAMVSSYEAGHALPSLESLSAYLGALGCGLGDLQKAMDRIVAERARPSA